MKLTNIKTAAGIHLAAETPRGLVDLTSAGFPHTMQDLICGADRSVAESLAADESLPVVDDNGRFVGFISRSGLFNSYRKTLVDFTAE